MYQAGGRITINIGGTTYSPRGSAKINTAGVENDVMVNHDGTVSRSTKPKAIIVKVSFDRGKASNGTQRPKWDTSFMQEFVDCTVLEKDVGRLHTLSGASIMGEPELDTETGEVSGLTLCTDDGNYTQVDV